MKNKYTQFMDNVVMNEQQKENLSNVIHKQIDQEKHTKKKRLSFKKAVLTCACIVCIFSISSFIYLITLKTSDPSEASTENTFPLGSAYEDEASTKIVFNSVEYRILEETGKNYLLLNGYFDCEQFSMDSNWVLLECSETKISEGILFSSDLTQTRSEADLHIDVEYNQTKGDVQFVFELTDFANELILKNKEQGNFSNWEFKLFIEGCYVKGSRAYFTFDFSEIRFY